MVYRISFICNIIYCVEVYLFFIARFSIGLDEERTLLNQLFKDYNKQVRPVLEVNI